MRYRRHPTGGRLSAEPSRTVGGIESARLSAGCDCDRHLEARAGVRLLNCAAEGCDGVGDLLKARDRDTSLRNMLANAHGELTNAGNLAAWVSGKEDGDGHKGCPWVVWLVDVREAEALQERWSVAVADLAQQRPIRFFGVAAGRPGEEELAFPEPAVAQRVGLERGAVFGWKSGGAGFWACGIELLRGRWLSAGCVRRSGGEGRVDPCLVLVVDGFARLCRVVGVKAEDVIGDPLRLGRGVEDFAAVLL